MQPCQDCVASVVPFFACILVGGAAALFTKKGLSCVGPAVSHGKRGARLVARVSAKYLERCGPKDADVPFSAAAATGPEHPVDFKRRPFGILRYQSGQGGKGAMAMEVIPISRYSGDAQWLSYLDNRLSKLWIRARCEVSQRPSRQTP